ncbi:MAG: hypothetical protein JNM42_18140 [Propionivibrio sp.]|uniref:DUF6776 family protein n=1 Tax=Propionivibrio sp. TaxID=2212460 RepID=UPI001A408D54|nr:DUF6776 family protein [Propionivibrio sp.]MBL8416348.1 hypothetical protein [Propionivibrio sp.]
MATPGASVKIKRLRQRFGINAPKLAIRTHVAWYWRASAVIVILSVSLALAAWIYDAGRRIAGFHSNESVREIQSLSNHLMELDAELTKLRSLVGSGESSLLLERAAQQQLTRQAKALEVENAALKEDLAFFEGLMLASKAGDELGARIENLKIEPIGNLGEHRYRMLVINSGGRQAKELKGSLQILVKVQEGGKDAMITIPSATEPNPQRFRFEIKHFQRIEGVFSVPSGALVKEVEVRLLQDGSLRARQSVTL